MNKMVEILDIQHSQVCEMVELINLIANNRGKAISYLLKRVAEENAETLAHPNPNPYDLWRGSNIDGWLTGSVATPGSLRNKIRLSRQMILEPVTEGDE